MGAYLDLTKRLNPAAIVHGGGMVAVALGTNWRSYLLF
jgi:hypothetical protein